MKLIEMFPLINENCYNKPDDNVGLSLSYHLSFTLISDLALLTYLVIFNFAKIIDLLMKL